MPNADQQAAEVVGEFVERRDRVADFAVVVRSLAADVVRNRVDNEHANSAGVACELT